MSRYITLGTYTNEGAAGLVDGDSDRRAAMEVAHIALEPHWWTIGLPAANMTFVSYLTLIHLK